MDIELTLIAAFSGAMVALVVCAVMIYSVQKRMIQRILTERSALAAERSHQRAIQDRRISALMAIHSAFYALNQAVLQYSALIAAGSKPEHPAFHQIVELQKALSECISRHSIFIDEELESLLSRTSSDLARLAREVHDVISEAERSRPVPLSTEDRLDAFDRILTEGGPLIGVAKDAIKSAIMELKPETAAHEFASV